MRKAIWDHFGASLNLQETEIDVSKADAKDICEKLQNYLLELILNLHGYAVHHQLLINWASY